MPARNLKSPSPIREATAAAPGRRVGLESKPSLPKSQIPKLNRSLQELNKINRQQFDFINNKQNTMFGSASVLSGGGDYVNEDAFDKRVSAESSLVLIGSFNV